MKTTKAKAMPEFRAVCGPGIRLLRTVNPYIKAKQIARQTLIDYNLLHRALKAKGRPVLSPEADARLLRELQALGQKLTSH